jgi:hypothetical protein
MLSVAHSFSTFAVSLGYRVCLGGTPNSHLAGHLVQSRASLPAENRVDLCKCNSLIHLKQQLRALFSRARRRSPPAVARGR